MLCASLRQPAGRWLACVVARPGEDALAKRPCGIPGRSAYRRSIRTRSASFDVGQYSTAPKGQRQNSPGQRPGDHGDPRARSPERAKQGQPPVTPVQGLVSVYFGGNLPARCPGLTCSAPSGPNLASKSKTPARAQGSDPSLARFDVAQLFSRPERAFTCQRRATPWGRCRQ
jgi:hypothetical protein